MSKVLILTTLIQSFYPEKTSPCPYFFTVEIIDKLNCAEIFKLMSTDH